MITHNTWKRILKHKNFFFSFLILILDYISYLYENFGENDMTFIFRSLMYSHYIMRNKPLKPPLSDDKCIFWGENGIIDMVKFGVKLPKIEHCKGHFLFLILILDYISYLYENFGENEMTFNFSLDGVTRP